MDTHSSNFVDPDAHTINADHPRLIYKSVYLLSNPIYYSRPASMLLQKRYLRGKSPPRIIEGGKEGLSSTNLVVSSCIRCHTSQEKGERNKSPVDFKQTGEKFARPHSRKLVKVPNNIT